MRHQDHAVGLDHRMVKRNLYLCLGYQKHFFQINYPTYQRMMQMDCLIQRIEQMLPVDHHDIDM